MTTNPPRPFGAQPEGNSIRSRILISTDHGPELVSFTLSAQHAREYAAQLIVSADSADNYQATLRACLVDGLTDHEDAVRNVEEMQ